MKVAAAFAMLVLTLALAPVGVSAQQSGSIYEAEGAEVPELFIFSVSGQTFVAAILTFGGGGNGRWFAAIGSTDGVNGSGVIVSPSGFAFTLPPGASLQFQLDQPGGAAGSFTTTGLSSFLSLPSGRFVRIFP
jgi:hypothetical protein